MNTFTTLPSEEVITTTRESLQKNGFNPIFVNTIEEAKEKALALIPQGAEIMTMTSVTLDTLGLPKEINESGRYDSVRAKLIKMDRTTQGRDMQKLGAAPDIAIGSVHAVTEDGHVLIASRTGSQLPAYVYGAGKVIWVVGAQKIVKDVEEGQRRVFEHSLPLESERANKAYHMSSGSQVDKLVTYYREVNPNRVTLILVNQLLGF